MTQPNHIPSEDEALRRIRVESEDLRWQTDHSRHADRCRTLARYARRRRQRPKTSWRNIRFLSQPTFRLASPTLIGRLPANKSTSELPEPPRCEVSLDVCVSSRSLTESLITAGHDVVSAVAIDPATHEFLLEHAVRNDQSTHRR